MCPACECVACACWCQQCICCVIVLFYCNCFCTCSIQSTVWFDCQCVFIDCCLCCKCYFSKSHCYCLTCLCCIEACWFCSCYCKVVPCVSLCYCNSDLYLRFILNFASACECCIAYLNVYAYNSFLFLYAKCICVSRKVDVYCCLSICCYYFSNISCLCCIKCEAVK